MAPEFFNKNSYEPSVDVWALGCVFHEMLFGNVYFTGRSLVEVKRNVLNKIYQIPSVPKVGDLTKQLLTQCIEKNASIRLKA